MSVAVSSLSSMWVALLALANLLALAACIAIVRFRAKRQLRQVKLLNAAIREYFLNSGVKVDVASTRLGDDKKFVAFVESEPMKRFRLSHIIEMALRDHVAKTYSIHLAKIYWRFPLKEAATTAKPATKVDDSYINEGLVYYRDLPKGDVQEVSWEKFEESAAMNTIPAPEITPPAQIK